MRMEWSKFAANPSSPDSSHSPITNLWSVSNRIESNGADELLNQRFQLIIGRQIWDTRTTPNRFESLLVWDSIPNPFIELMAGKGNFKFAVLLSLIKVSAMLNPICNSQQKFYRPHSCRHIHPQRSPCAEMCNLQLCVFTGGGGGDQLLAWFSLCTRNKMGITFGHK